MNKWTMLLPCLLLNVTAWALNPEEALQARLQAMQTFQADFKQEVKAKQKLISQSTGKMALARPGHFRWQTISPLQQVIVADGTNMWIYDVDLEQVTVKKQDKGVGKTAALFLSGYDDTVGPNFEVEEKVTGKLAHYFLKAKSNKESFQKVELMFDDKRLRQLRLFDQLGQVTNVTFHNIKDNPKLSASLFQFKPPKGVDVIKQ